MEGRRSSLGGRGVEVDFIDNVLLLNLQAFQVGKVFAPVARGVSTVASWQVLAARYNIDSRLAAGGGGFAATPSHAGQR